MLMNTQVASRRRTAEYKLAVDKASPLGNTVLVTGAAGTGEEEVLALDEAEYPGFFKS
jgi:hypothetical protein